MPKHTTRPATVCQNVRKLYQLMREKHIQWRLHYNNIYLYYIILLHRCIPKRFHFSFFTRSFPQWNSRILRTMFTACYTFNDTNNLTPTTKENVFKITMLAMVFYAMNSFDPFQNVYGSDFSNQRANYDGHRITVHSTRGWNVLTNVLFLSYTTLLNSHAVGTYTHDRYQISPRLLGKPTREDGSCTRPVSENYGSRKSNNKKKKKMLLITGNRRCV